MPAQFIAPLSTSKLLAAQVLRGEIAPGTLLKAGLSRGPVLGVGRPVNNTDWYVIAKMDRSEMFPGLARQPVAGLRRLADPVHDRGGSLILRQRQRLSASQRQRETQAERLRSLELLDHLVRSSDDIIYVEDDEEHPAAIRPAAASSVSASPMSWARTSMRYLAPGGSRGGSRP